MKLETLKDALVHELKDLYSAETQLLKALPEMSRAASNSDLVNGMETHLEETRHHVNRLETVFAELDVSARGEMCVGMEGLIAESAKILGEDASPGITDALLICAAQKVEHYEISAYGTAISFAERLGLGNIARVLSQTLEEEKATDKKLTAIAEGQINAGAQPPDDSGIGDELESDETLP